MTAEMTEEIAGDKIAAEDTAGAAAIGSGERERIGGKGDANDDAGICGAVGGGSGSSSGTARVSTASIF